jgi:Peptidase family M23
MYPKVLQILLKPILIGTLIIVSNSGFSQLTDQEVMDRKMGRYKKDTSYVYTLPYKEGKRILLIQAANSEMSHKDELSLDFKMNTGTPICASREGVVIETKEDSDEGGVKEEYLAKGNHIIILHSDGSKAKYWHLKKEGVVVNVGDTVTKGQTIGYSGNTGYTAFPHLHFQVVDKSGKQIMTRFYTKKGVLYPRPGNWYRAVREPR